MNLPQHEIISIPLDVDEFETLLSLRHEIPVGLGSLEATAVIKWRKDASGFWSGSVIVKPYEWGVAMSQGTGSFKGEEE